VGYLRAQQPVFRPRPLADDDQLPVDKLDALLEALRAEGVEIVPHREEYDYGRFAWIIDPQGNKIEL